MTFIADEGLLPPIPGVREKTDPKLADGLTTVKDIR